MCNWQPKKPFLFIKPHQKNQKIIKLLIIETHSPAINPINKMKINTFALMILCVFVGWITLMNKHIIIIIYSSITFFFNQKKKIFCDLSINQHTQNIPIPFFLQRSLSLSLCLTHFLFLKKTWCGKTILYDV